MITGETWDEIPLTPPLGGDSAQGSLSFARLITLRDRPFQKSNIQFTKYG
jgi:hypothetical protein